MHELRSIEDIVILVSADAEWQVLYECPHIKSIGIDRAFYLSESHLAQIRIPIFRTGWGKIASAATTQKIIDTYRPKLIISIGTCGGFRQDTNLFDLLWIDRTVVYDINSILDAPEGELAHYSVQLETSWIGERAPQNFRLATLLTADRDIVPGPNTDFEVETLRAKYGGSGVDWEAGAIAYVARMNSIKCLILKGVSDIVNPATEQGQARHTVDFRNNVSPVMQALFRTLPQWLPVVTTGQE
jgi:adenosylhomocysteine nucleosidase